MATHTQFQSPLLSDGTACHHHEQLNKESELILGEFDAVLLRYIGFNLFFLCLCALEMIALIFLFGFLAHSFVLALSLAIVFFTCFAYFTLRIYYQAKKPEQFKEIKEKYLLLSKNLIGYKEGDGEHCIALAHACCRLANRLHAKEYSYYALPKWLSPLTPWVEQLSCRWHWRDIHDIKEQLLQESVNEHLKLVKCQPTSLQAHAALANAYVMLSGLYIDPRKMDGFDDERWIPANKYDEEFRRTFRITAERAIEEFKILSEYAPDDPWVHSQLAYSYHDLQMPMEEIREYETIQRLLPDDKDNLYKLGMLYFQHGLNAKGLRVYEELRKTHYKQAENLIKHYGMICFASIVAAR